MTSNLARMRALKKKVTMKPRENYSCGDLPQCHVMLAGDCTLYRSLRNKEKFWKINHLLHVCSHECSFCTAPKMCKTVPDWNDCEVGKCI